VIEERAVISRVGDDGVWVRAFGAETCERCAQGRGCGGGVLSRLVQRRRSDVAVESHISTPQIGEVVIVGVQESALMQASLAVYALPLLGMLAAGAFAHQVLAAHDLLVAGFGLAGLFAGLLGTYRLGLRAQAGNLFRPVLLRRAALAETACGRLS
jgi:sigma-E factor negative regulatory protein RseC